MKRALIYVHYDKDGIIDPHVHYALEKYRPFYEKIILVSTASKVAPNNVDLFISRENVGHDFMSYKIGLENLPNYQDYDEVTFANDSVYAPFYDLAAMYNHDKIKGADIWGVVSSNMKHYHLQSWFVTYRKSVLSHPSFQAFWDKVTVLKTIPEIIDAYEVGGTQYFLEQGFTIKSIYHSPESRVQPTKVRAMAILEAVPYVKVLLFRSFPTYYQTDLVKKRLEKINPILLHLSLNHAKRTKAKLTPKYAFRWWKYGLFTLIGAIFGEKIYRKLRKDK